MRQIRRLAPAALVNLLWLGHVVRPLEAQHQPATAVDAVSERIARIENAFPPISTSVNQPSIKLDFQQVMRISNVPGLSVAVVDDYKIAWAKGYGLTEASGNTPVTTHTPFPACSISKPISAMAALQLVEQGRLSLDEDVNLKLTSWKVPENGFTKEQKVTLRRILTHTAGTTVHGYPGYPVGQPIPTLLQILNGEKPANTDPVRVDFVPGTKQRYSGGGFAILQQLMIDVTGKPFPQIMQDLVLDKLGLQDSTFEQPLPASRAATAAIGLNLHGGGPVPANVSPEMAVGGLWTTPSDLAKIAIEVALSKQAKSDRVLSTAMTREMLRLQVDPQIESAQRPSMRMGLGWKLGDESDPARFEHDGVNIGFRAELIMWDAGHGVVVMWNDWSFASELAVRYLINNTAKEYGWSYRVAPYTPPLYADTELLAIARLRGTQAAIAKYYELKRLSAEQKGKGAPTVIWTSDPPDFPPNEWDLFVLANTLADAKHVKDAIQIMKVEVSEYPKWTNAYGGVNGYAGLADLYARAGEQKLAIQTYEKLLQLEPGNAAATEALKKFKDKK
jgi:CubicO group peptidase (beta-lactamase class C family)